MKSLLLLSVLLCTYTTTFGQNRKMNNLLKQWDNDSTPGISVAILKNGKAIYKNHLGMANLEDQISVSAKSKFNTSLVSLQFTSYAILLLEKQGKLNLDDDIRKHIPEFPFYGDTITLLHLATHTSGLRGYGALHNMQGWHWGDVILKSAPLNLIIKQKELNFKPDEGYNFSSSDFHVLAEVVERVSNQSFAQFCKKNIFEPLDMNNTLVREDRTEIISNRTQSYYNTGDRFVNAPSNDESVGVSNIFTTLDDLIKWFNNFSSPRSEDNSIISKMSKHQIVSLGDTLNCGLGVKVSQYRGLSIISQSGGDAGYRTEVNFFPELNFTVILLSNNSTTNTYKLSKDIIDMYLSKELAPAPLMESNDLSLNNTSNQFTNQQVSGKYIHESLQPGIIIEVFNLDSVLNVKMDFIKQHFHIGNNVGNKYELLENPPVKFIFKDSLNGQPQTVYKHEMGHVSKWIRMKEEVFSQTKLSDYVGEFHSEELSTTYNLKIVDGQLKLEHPGVRSCNFKQTGVNTFQGSVWYLNQLKFVRNSTGVIIGLKISNVSSKNIYFGKV